jgi:hypothetical protein
MSVYDRLINTYKIERDTEIRFRSEAATQMKTLVANLKDVQLG